MTAPRITAALLDFRLRLNDEMEVRRLRGHDADALFEVTSRNAEHLAPWMSWIDSVQDASDSYAFLRAAEKEAYEHTSFKAGIWRHDDLIGAIDLHNLDWTNRCARIGYWLDKDATGHGFMTNAVTLLGEYAFDALGFHRLEIHIATENHRSRRIPERLGYVLEGILRDAQLLRGRYLDHVLYALIREDGRM